MFLLKHFAIMFIYFSWFDYDQKRTYFVGYFNGYSNMSFQMYISFFFNFENTLRIIAFLMFSILKIISVSLISDTYNLYKSF